MKFSTGKMAKLANGAVVAEVKLYVTKIGPLLVRAMLAERNHDSTRQVEKSDRIN